MNYTYMDAICHLICDRNIYKNGILRGILNFSINDVIKDFCRKYLKTYLYGFLNVVKDPLKIELNSVYHKNYISYTLQNYITILNENNKISICNKTYKHSITVNMINIKNFNNELHPYFFDQNTVKKSILSIPLLKNIILIDVLPYSSIKIPINFINYLYNKNIVSSNYIFIRIGKNSNINFYMSNISKNSSINSNLINIILNKNSVLEYTNFQNEYKKSYSLNNFIVTQGFNSTFILNNICLNGNLFVNNILVNQDKPSGKFITCWINIGDLDQKVHDTLKINHNSNYGKSLKRFKGLFYNNSSRILKNLVTIKKNTKGITSHQISENLILSPNSYIKILPAMKIYSNDIQCTHGVVIDKLDKSLLFYMCSRGINKKAAENIVIFSFIKKLLGNIKHGKIRKDVWFYFKNKLQCILL